MLGQVRPEATHEVVLGDLFGSQWIKDDEFLSRVRRYRDIIFKDVRCFFGVYELIVAIGGTYVWGG